MLTYRELIETIHFATKCGQKEIYYLIFKITKWNLLNIQSDKYATTSTRNILREYIL